MRGSCRPSLGLTLYPFFSLPGHGPASVALRGRFFGHRVPFPPEI